MENLMLPYCRICHYNFLFQHQHSLGTLLPICLRFIFKLNFTFYLHECNGSVLLQSLNYMLKANLYFNKKCIYYLLLHVSLTRLSCETYQFMF